MSMRLRRAITNLVETGPLLKEGMASGNLKVLANLLGPAFRGLIMETQKNGPHTRMPVGNTALFDWEYRQDKEQLQRLYEAAKRDQWNATTDIDWTGQIDPYDPNVMLLPNDYLIMQDHPAFKSLSKKEMATQRHAILTWLLSQFLHGEQGALYAAAQVTSAVPWMDAKLYGSTQVVDEGRHVEVFHRYLTEKLERLYTIDDNLYVIIDALMRDSRWDMKFLGMQIMIEGLALGSFATIRAATDEPLLKNMLGYVIADEARHVQFGVVALRDWYVQNDALSERERREREDWVFELTLLMRNRFLAHEIYDEYWAHAMSRKAWDKLVLGSGLMKLFRRTMFKRVIPNIKRIGLLSDRVRPRYAALGILQYENERDATRMSPADMLVPA
ncbi:MAG: ferritin-like domain-containing protein [Deltaproteobacteria bacterium]|nr:ferritin-like domain-containing protein [Deltaproteobacteria bacterium]